MSRNLRGILKDLNPANQITLLRIFSLIPIIILLSYPNPTTCTIACFLFFLASVTDFLDGYIARKFHYVSNLGKFLDPLADKLLICAIFVQMTYLTWVPAWVTIIIIIRELAVTGLRAVAADENIVIAADKYGKWKTICQSLALGPLIYHYPLFEIDVTQIAYYILVLALILTIYSGVNYFLNFYRSVYSSLQQTNSKN